MKGAIRKAALARYQGNRSGRLKIGNCVISEKPEPEHRPFSKHLLRLREVERVIQARHGMTVPETDDADVYIEAAAYALNAHCHALQLADLDMLLTGWCGRWAPWALPRAGVIVRPILNQLVRRKYDLKADAVATLLQITYGERQMLSLSTIGACDVPRHLRRSMARARKRDIDRMRQAEVRRQSGKQPRQSFLAANSLSRLKPWIALEISRRTWYRRFGTGPSPLGDIIIGDTPVPNAVMAAIEAMPSKPPLPSRPPSGADCANDDTEQPNAHEGLGRIGGANG